MNALHRIGVLGDIHAEDARLSRVLTFLKGHDLDAIASVGDIVDGMGDVERTIDLLQEASVLSVAGNHERWFLENEMRELAYATLEVSEAHRQWIESLPRTLHINTHRGAVMFCHGVGQDDMSMLKKDTQGYALQAIDSLRELMLDSQTQYMVGGHTHERMIRSFPGLTVVNAGTLHRDDPNSGFVIVDFEAQNVEWWDVSSSAIQKHSTHDLPAPLPLTL